MGLRAFRSGCNVLAYEKEGHKYGMVCAWATMIDYEHIGMLIGAQSVTGRNLEVGDIVGVTALAEGQVDLSLKLGETHSDECDKFEGVAISKKDSAIFVEDSKCKMLCEVVKFVKLIDPDDNFVVLKVLEHTSDLNKDFLSLEDVYPED